MQIYTYSIYNIRYYKFKNYKKTFINNTFAI